MKSEQENIIQNEGLDTEEKKNCIICLREGIFVYRNLRDTLFDAPGLWNIRYCKKCDLYWIDPVVKEHDLWKIYRGYYTHKVPQLDIETRSIRSIIKNGILATSLGYKELVRNNIELAFGKLASYIGPIKEIAVSSYRWLKSSQKGKLLDIGCGNGKFLYQMKRLGWEVYGVENDSGAFETAQRILGSNVFCGNLQDAGFPDNHFDVITVSHVIEHVLEPLALLEECRRILKPKGILVIITPNSQSLCKRIFGENWRSWEVPRHVFIFSPQSLKTLVEKSGLRISSIQTSSGSARWMWVAGRLLKKRGTLPGGIAQNTNTLIKIEGIIFWIVEYLISRIKNVGEELVIFATK